MIYTSRFSESTVYGRNKLWKDRKTQIFIRFITVFLKTTGVYNLPTQRRKKKKTLYFFKKKYKD